MRIPASLIAIAITIVPAMLPTHAHAQMTPPSIRTVAMPVAPLPPATAAPALKDVHMVFVSQEMNQSDGHPAKLIEVHMPTMPAFQHVTVASMSHNQK